MVNRLAGSRAYLCGAMDRVADGGYGWRKEMSDWLMARRIIPLNPCDKPISIGPEDLESRERRQKWKSTSNFDQLAADYKIVRCCDLRMVDICDFVIVNLDVDVHACGTYEELFWANRCKKPILIRVPQGKLCCPDWLFGVIPHETIFTHWGDVQHYIEAIAAGELNPTDRRWYFFDYPRLTPDGAAA